MALQPGEQLGAYEIVELLGAGGMATVYKAYHAKLNRFVAVKMMHAQLLVDANFHQRFEREAQVVASLEHPHIVPVYDYSEYQNQPYLVMKYIEGETLKMRIQQAALPLITIRLMMRRVASALDYAHSKGVLHRDMKPSNLIIGYDDTPYITDFGLARLMHAGESTMSADMMLGTPQYISPEQARGDKDIDHRTDLYAFAVILYELLVGRVPFSADTAYATVHDQIYTAPPPPSAVNPEITPAVEVVLLRALSKTPQDRYPSAGALMQALEEALDASNLETLSPSRIANVVPVQHTSSPIPPAVRGAVSAHRADSADFSDDFAVRKAKNEMHYESDAQIEARVRKFIEKKNDQKRGLMVNASVFVLVNLFLHFQALSGGVDAYLDKFPYPFVVTFFWGLGVFAQYRNYDAKFGSGRDKIDDEVQAEMARERARVGGYKQKNDDYYDPASRIRLTEDGELTDSFIEEQQEYQDRR